MSDRSNAPKFIVFGTIPVIKTSNSDWVSVYKGVLVEWDLDFDTRALQAVDFIQGVLSGVNSQLDLVRIYEREGCVELTFSGPKHALPESLKEAIELPFGDVWQVSSLEFVGEGSE